MAVSRRGEAPGAREASPFPPRAIRAFRQTWSATSMCRAGAKPRCRGGAPLQVRRPGCPKRRAALRLRPVLHPPMILHRPESVLHGWAEVAVVDAAAELMPGSAEGAAAAAAREAAGGGEALTRPDDRTEERLAVREEPTTAAAAGWRVGAECFSPTALLLRQILAQRQAAGRRDPGPRSVARAPWSSVRPWGRPSAYRGPAPIGSTSANRLERTGSVHHGPPSAALRESRPAAAPLQRRSARGRRDLATHRARATARKLP